MSTNYGVILDGLQALDRLEANGRIDSPEANAAREAIDKAMTELTEAEREWFRKLSKHSHSMPSAAPANSKLQGVPPSGSFL